MRECEKAVVHDVSNALEGCWGEAGVEVMYEGRNMCGKGEVEACATTYRV
jgi:hypothetical protein